MKYLLILAGLFAAGKIQSQSLPENLKITGATYAGDTVTIILLDHYYGEAKTHYMPNRRAEVVANDGHFSFRFNKITGPVNYSITFAGAEHKRVMLRYYFAVPGDSIHIQQYNYKHFSFSGKGSELAICKRTIDSLGSIRLFELSTQTKSFTYMKQRDYARMLPAYYKELGPWHTYRMHLLDSFRTQLSQTAYDLMKACLVGQNAGLFLSHYKYAFAAIPATMNEDSALVLRNTLQKLYLDHEPDMKVNLPQSVLSCSIDYLRAAAAIAAQHATIFPGKKATAIIREKYQGELRDAILTVYTMDCIKSNESAESAITSALNMITTNYYKNALDLYRKKYLKGVTAYNFALPDVNGKIRRLSDFKGKKVVLDYWYTGCTGCVQLYTGALKEVENKYAGDSTIVFISISSDRDKSVWLQSIKKDLYTSITSVNLNASSGYKHPAFINYGVDAAPTLVIIDENGKVIANQYAPRTPAELLKFIQQR